MSAPTATSGVQPQTSSEHYRLPGIVREGIAQLSLLETALWPLKGGMAESGTFDTRYSFTSRGQVRQSGVSVYAPHGLQSVDEYILWGLLGICLSRSGPEPTLLATPYWMIKRLGMAMGGFQYDQLRASLERLAAVAYQNTAFYNPLTQQHERVTLHFFSSYLPTRGRGGDVDAQRAWRIEWSPMFFRMCQATGGSLLFDLDRWIRITDAAMHERPRGFPGFRSSPAAFLIDGIQNGRMPPDWIDAHDKERKRRQWEAEKAALAADEQQLREQFAAERAAALQAFLESPEGRRHYAAYQPTFLEFLL